MSNLQSLIIIKNGRLFGIAMFLVPDFTPLPVGFLLKRLLFIHILLSKKNNFKI